MAEIDTGGGKKVSTRVDMTPMVDLAFLLITFFMLTTTFSKPKAMEVNMPDKSDKPDDKLKVAASRSTTFILGEKDLLLYYQGEGDNATIQEINYTPSGIRSFLKKDIARVYSLNGKGKGPIYIIKAMKQSRYKNIVDILDEMAIISNYKIQLGGEEIKAAPSYAMVEITKDDEDLVTAYLGNAGGTK
jgi:biopolymer transport protein ExbD